MLTIKPKKPTYKEALQTLKNEVQRAVHKGAVQVMPNGNLKCKPLTNYINEFGALFLKLTPLTLKQQTKLLNTLGGNTLKEALQAYAMHYANGILAKQKRTMHPAKYALMLEVYKLANKRAFNSYRFYKQAKGCYKMHCFLSEQTANKICKEYNKHNSNLGYIATPRKRQNGTLNSEYYHVVLMPKQ
jgi:hypothetical protein